MSDPAAAMIIPAVAKGTVGHVQHIHRRRLIVAFNVDVEYMYNASCVMYMCHLHVVSCTCVMYMCISLEYNLSTA
jgi:hypothetical protein